MLPDGFQWGQYIGWMTGPPLCLKLDGKEIARLTQRVDNGVWLALLAQHLPWESPERRTRTCRSYETGVAGIEAWALRHEARLRDEVKRGRT